MSSEQKQDLELPLKVSSLSIEKELKTSFLDYAMSVIISRALPDVRDGLKPVHRRILYSMHTLGYYHEKAYRKSATVVGDVIGHYHPHGDQAIYQSMVGMVQPFSKRYPLLDGQGNWGSVDGDNAAAMRYTEVRMGKIARDILADIEKETVHFVPNFDESRTEPTLLPSKIPNLLVNGSNGIAVGMATSIPPHNLREVVNACIALLQDPNISDDALFEIIPAPDFPTGGIICGRAGIIKAYRTGHGQVTVRGVVDIEEDNKRSMLVIKEIPFQVNKADLISKIADLAKNKIIEGITNIRDESNKQGIRVVIELRKSEIPQVILNQLYKHTSLQDSYSIILLAIYQNRPFVFTLREMLAHFLAHRREIITKRTEFDLGKAQARAHILQGLIIALDNIDPVIVLIKAADSAEEASTALQGKFKLTEIQAKAILEMRLQRLTGLERGKIHDELGEIKTFVARCQLLLSDENVLKKEIIDELEQVKKNYSDERRTVIKGAVEGIAEIDLVPDEEVVVTLTKKGYIKRVLLETYVVQHRGGKGKKAIADLEDADDVIEDLFAAKNHDELLFFTNKGRLYSMRVFQVPEASRTARGRAIVNLLPLGEGERVVKLLCARGLTGKQLVMVTRKGVIKKTPAIAFAKVRSTGIRAIGLHDGDELEFCDLSSGNDTIVIITSLGQGIRFKETEVRSMGRQAAGVRGIKTKANDFVVGLEVVDGSDCDLLFATSRGYGKRVKSSDFRIAHRGGLGVRTIPVGGRNGTVIGVTRVTEESTILLIDSNGKIIRLSPQEVRTMGRQAKGVRLIRLDATQVLHSLTAFEESAEEKPLTLAPADIVPEGGIPDIETPEETEPDIIEDEDAPEEEQELNESENDEGDDEEDLE